MNSKYVYAATIIVLAFFGFSGTLIITNHAADLRAFMLIIGQAVGFLLNFWLIHKNATAQRSDSNQVKKTLQEVKDTVDGNTPRPFPPVRS